jgi:hypothetical protein
MISILFSNLTVKGLAKKANSIIYIATTSGLYEAMFHKKRNISHRTVASQSRKSEIWFPAFLFSKFGKEPSSGTAEGESCSSGNGRQNSDSVDMDK